MSNRIKGRNVFAQMEIDSVYYPIFCAKTASLIDDVEEIEITHVNSGPNRDYFPGMGSKMLEVTGLSTSDNTNGRISPVYLLQASQRRQVYNMRWVMTDDSSNVVTISFRAFIKNITLSREIASYSGCSASFRICGAIDISEVAPPEEPVCEVADPIYADLAEGSTTYTNALLIGPTITILMVARSGVVFSETTGTPGNLQFFFDNTTGTISFQNPGAAAPLEPLYIEYKVI